jgi:hypothetical protein
VAVFELASPRYKDRPEARRQFAAKSASYLQRGIGLVVADIVTRHQPNLHNEFIRLFGATDDLLMPGHPPLYAVAYCPTRRDERNWIDLYPHPLALGGELPLVPLALKGFGCVRLDLNATYAEACERSRIP